MKLTARERRKPNCGVIGMISPSVLRQLPYHFWAASLDKGSRFKQESRTAGRIDHVQTATMPSGQGQDESLPAAC
jgi:hypothetical protein